MKKWHSLLGRSFTKREQKMVGTGAFITSLLIVISLCTIFQEWANLPSPLDIIRSPGVVDHVAKKKALTADNKSNGTDTRSSERQQLVPEHFGKWNPEKMENRTLRSIPQESSSSGSSIMSNDDVGVQRRLSGMCRKGGISEFCVLKGDIRIDPKAATVYYVVPSEAVVLDNINTTIKPYARNDNAGAMESVREWTVKMVPNDQYHLPNCSQLHDSPGVIFSLAGFCGNVFHSFSDVLIPLFATARPFNRHVELLITDYRTWFVSKFISILQALSRYKVIDIDDEQRDGKIHCFSRLTLGLKGRQSKELSINSSESEFTIIDFKKLLRSAYSLKKTTAIRLEAGEDEKKKKSRQRPVLLIITREATRALKNVEEVERTATEVGFNVSVAEIDGNVSKSAEIMNSCDVVLGVHGAGLTNMVFLPENAVQIQVVPFDTDWIAKNAYGDPTREMQVRYLEYKIGIEESSLSERYPADHPFFTNPGSFVKQGWKVWSSIYMENQNVTLHIPRFKPTLFKALELLHH